jgi:TnpA family transposase
MLRKLGSYARQSGLEIALRELGRIERALFILDWRQSMELRRRAHAHSAAAERPTHSRALFSSTALVRSEPVASSNNDTESAA